MDILNIFSFISLSKNLEEPRDLRAAIFLSLQQRPQAIVKCFLQWDGFPVQEYVLVKANMDFLMNILSSVIEGYNPNISG